MQLTRSQIRTALRDRPSSVRPTLAPEDALLDAMCLRLAGLPDVRWPKVHEARARLAADGPPSAAVLADMLVTGCAR